MPRYMAFVDEPIDPADFDVEFDPAASLAENTRWLADAVGFEDGELYYTMSKFYAVGIFEAPDNRTAEQIVRDVRNTGDVQAEVVPMFTPAELEAWTAWASAAGAPKAVVERTHPLVSDGRPRQHPRIGR